MRGCFVTGTGTEVGKSVVAASVCAALGAAGERVAAFKPAVSGLDDEPGDWPHDHELLAAAASAGQRPEEVAPHRFGPAVSPHLAAELAGERIDPAALRAGARDAAARGDALVVEGVGGFLVPLTLGYLIRDLAIDLGLPVVIAAAPGLGTINHTLLTVESVRGAGLRLAGVVITPWPEVPGDLRRSNRDAIERLGKVEVVGLPPTSPERLADAGRALPLAEWI